ncbi:MAG: hypothetical protein R3C53_11600 [Pirellulaceae bacterium]
MKEPRPHAMQAKYLLAQMALQDVGRFFATFGASGDLDYLGNLWDAIGQQVPSDQQIPCDGIGTFHSDPDGIPDHIVICFPAPETRNEAYFLAAVKQDDVARVFCLEKSENPITRQETTVVSEFAKHGRANWGDGGAASAKEFIDHVAAIIGDSDAQPISFIPMNFA